MAYMASLVGMVSVRNEAEMSEFVDHITFTMNYSYSRRVVYEVPRPLENEIPPHVGPKNLCVSSWLGVF